MLSVNYAAQSLKSSISKISFRRSTFSPDVRSAYSDKSGLVFNRLVKYEGPDPPSAHLDSAGYRQSGFAGRIVLRRIDKLTNLRPLVSRYLQGAVLAASGRSRSAPGRAPFGRCEHKPALSGSGHPQGRDPVPAPGGIPGWLRKVPALVRIKIA